MSNLYDPITDEEKEQFSKNTDLYAPIDRQELEAHESQPWLDKAKEFFVGKNYDWSNLPKDLLQGQVDAIPAYAGAAASVLSAGNPLVTGAATSAGDSLKRGINHLAHDDLSFENEFRLPTAKEVGRVTNNAIESFNTGAISEMGGQLIANAPEAWRAAKSGANSLGKSFRKGAGQLAENSTGATGAQASKFKDGAGNELLDRGLVRFGDNAENIANRVGSAMDSAHADIDSVLKTLDERGVVASADNVVAELEKRATALSRNPSQASVVKKIRGIIDDIIQTGESNVPISLAEETKRGFNQMSKNWMDPEVGQAGKQAYLSYMDEVESVANAADPSLAKKFIDAKKTHGLLSPIKEAAERRAATLNQSPIGGFLDVATTGIGAGMAAGPAAIPVGMAAAVGRKVLTPRISSSMAVSFDKISKVLMNSPQMRELAQKSPDVFQAIVFQLEKRMSAEAPLQRAAENQQERPSSQYKAPDKNELLQKTQDSKYGQVLKNAAARGDDAFNAAHFVLSQRDPEYRKHLDSSMFGSEA